MIILGKKCHSTLAFRDVSPTPPTTHVFLGQHEGNKGVTPIAIVITYMTYKEIGEYANHNILKALTPP